MDGQPYFITLAGLGVSLAGFASLIAWLREDATRWDAVNLWRVKSIVRNALSVTLVCLLLVPIHSLTASMTATIAWGSGGLAFLHLAEVATNRGRDSVVWHPASSWLVFIAINTALLGLQLLNFGWRSLGVLQLGILLFLTSPAGIFYNFISELSGEARPEVDEE